MQLLELADKGIKTVLTDSHIKHRSEVELIDLKGQLFKKKEIISSWTRATIIIVHKIIKYIRKPTLMWEDPKKFL